MGTIEDFNESDFEPELVALDKGKRGKAHRPKSSSSRSSHSSSGTNELPPILEPDAEPRNMSSRHRVTPRSSPRPRTGDSIIMVEPENQAGDYSRRPHSRESRRANTGLSEDFRTSTRSLPAPASSRQNSSLRRSGSEASPSWWAKLKGIGKKNQCSVSREVSAAPRPRVDPGEYNEQAQERRVKVILQMMQKTEEMNEEEYEAYLQAKQREKKQLKVEQEKRDERLFKQAMRGQLDCDTHTKTLYSLNHLLKVERDHDDSMVTSICDIILQKPQLRRDLIEYVRQEKDSVMNMLDVAAQSDPESIPRIAQAFADVQKSRELNQRSPAPTPIPKSPIPHKHDQIEKAQSTESKPENEPKILEVDETENTTSRRRKKKSKSKNKDNEEAGDKSPPTTKSKNREKSRDRRRRNKIDTSDSLVTARTAGLDTNPKTPAYPPTESMINNKDGSRPTDIDNQELANYVKSLENTVDDKLRVLLDAQGAQNDIKMPMGSGGGKSEKKPGQV